MSKAYPITKPKTARDAACVACATGQKRTGVSGATTIWEGIKKK